MQRLPGSCSPVKLNGVLVMRTLLLTAAASAIALASAAPAAAQDRDDSATTFTGPRSGVLLGYDKLQPGSGPNSSIGDDNNSATGLLYGGDIGYDVALGGIVLGAEGEITGSTRPPITAPPRSASISTSTAGVSARVSNRASAATPTPSSSIATRTTTMHGSNIPAVPTPTISASIPIAIRSSPGSVCASEPHHLRAVSRIK